MSNFAKQKSDILACAKIVVLIIIYTKTFMSNANKNTTKKTVAIATVFESHFL